MSAKALTLKAFHAMSGRLQCTTSRKDTVAIKRVSRNQPTLLTNPEGIEFLEVQKTLERSTQACFGQTARHTHPASKLTPPNGVIAPSHLMLVIASA